MRGTEPMRVLELFSGSGGAHLGLHRAGLHHVASVEWDADSCATMRAAMDLGRVHRSAVVEADIRDVDAWWGKLRHLEEGVDLLWSSFPCQCWSTAGKQLGAKDTERNGWPWTVAAIDIARPTWFMGENVPGLLSHSSDCNGDPLDCSGCYVEQVILPDLRARFAWVDVWLLDAADYGTPQRRRRVFFAAGPHPLRRPEPTHSGEALSIAKWVDGHYWRDVGTDEPVGSPSAAEQRHVDDHRQAGMFGPSVAYRLKPWRTVRQALGLEAWGTATNASSGKMGKPRSPDEPSLQPVAGGKALGGLYGWSLRTGQTTTTAAGRHPEGPRSVDAPSPAVRAQEGTGLEIVLDECRNTTANPNKDRPTPGDEPAKSVTGRGSMMLNTRVFSRATRVEIVLDQGRNFAANPRMERLTPGDEPAPVVNGGGSLSMSVRVIGGGTNPHSPDAEHERTYRDLTDEPCITLTAAQVGNRGPLVEDAAWARRRLSVEECARLFDMPDWPWQGTATSQYRQVGNMVAWRVSCAIGETLLGAHLRGTP